MAQRRRAVAQAIGYSQQPLPQGQLSAHRVSATVKRAGERLCCLGHRWREIATGLLADLALQEEIAAITEHGLALLRRSISRDMARRTTSFAQCARQSRILHLA
jgi:hypothetical protein